MALAGHLGHQARMRRHLKMTASGHLADIGKRVRVSALCRLTDILGFGIEVR